MKEIVQKGKCKMAKDYWEGQCPSCKEWLTECPCCDEVFCPKCGMLESEIETMEDEEDES